ncbi:MAG: cytidylate kinase family protein [Gemmatimonadota bacterium]|nr:cytidylate kinase family protein [Gemmatimonadota bacterium]
MAIVSICRGSKSGGQALAECLADYLDYPLLGREILQTTATAFGVSEEEVTHHFHRSPTVWDRHAAIRRVYVVAVQATLAEHLSTGNLVYHGLAGQVLLRGLPSVMRIRLIAPVEMRVRVLMESDGMTRSAADQHIRTVDAARARWVKMMYGEHIEDPTLYDMVINVATMSIPTACDFIAVGLQQPEFAVTDDVLSQFGDFRVACRVKLALVSESETRGLPLEVKAHAGVVTVSGSAPMLATGETGDRIAAIARGVRGVKEVRLKVQWFDPYP